MGGILFSVFEVAGSWLELRHGP